MQNIIINADDSIRAEIVRQLCAQAGLNVIDFHTSETRLPFQGSKDLEGSEEGVSDIIA